MCLRHNVKLEKEKNELQNGMYNPITNLPWIKKSYIHIIMYFNYVYSPTDYRWGMRWIERAGQDKESSLLLVLCPSIIWMFSTLISYVMIIFKHFLYKQSDQSGLKNVFTAINTSPADRQ